METHPDAVNMPKLRNVEPIPVVVRGVQAMGLKDPLGISTNMLCFPREALPVLSLLDGRHSLLDIQAELTRRAGRIVFMDELRAVIEKLDEVYLLDGQRFRQAFENKVQEYRRLPFRPQAHGGRSYSNDADSLKQEMQDLFSGPAGPGMPDFFSDRRRPVGLIAPHIDIKAGGRCFAVGYHALASGRPSDVYVIFGTGHAGVEGIFTATNLDFETPLGIVPTDREFVADLSRELGKDCASEEILHANEHVIEFQTVFLQYLLGERHGYSIVPILCALSHRYLDGREQFRAQRQMFDDFCGAVREVSRRAGKTVCFIASADLDHIGPRYGDSFVPHEGTVKSALERDERLLSSLERLEVDEFIGLVARDDDASRICGFSPITAMLHCMDASEGHLLGLDYAHVDEKNSFVSFTSMIFH